MSLLDRMVVVVERVRERLERATASLEAAQIPYAVIGSNAAAAWVATIEPGAVRNTQCVDILLRRGDFSAAREALESAGFIHQKTEGESERFIDGTEAGPRDVINLSFAGEKSRARHVATSDVFDSRIKAGLRILDLEPLVGMMLDSFRLDDRVDLRDMLDVGLIDASWKSRFSGELAERLQHLIDTPEG